MFLTLLFVIFISLLLIPMGRKMNACEMLVVVSLTVVRNASVV